MRKKVSVIFSDRWHGSEGRSGRVSGIRCGFEARRREAPVELPGASESAGRGWRVQSVFDTADHRHVRGGVAGIDLFCPGPVDRNRRADGSTITVDQPQQRARRPGIVVGRWPAGLSEPGADPPSSEDVARVHPPRSKVVALHEVAVASDAPAVVSTDS